MVPILTRRFFLQSSAAASASLFLPFYLAGHRRGRQTIGTSGSAPFSPNAWLELSAGGEVRIWCGKSEIGQGVRTALPMIIAVIPSSEPPGGCGELGVPAAAPALGNAIFAATGKRIHRLPIRAADLRSG